MSILVDIFNRDRSSSAVAQPTVTLLPEIEEETTTLLPSVTTAIQSPIQVTQTVLPTITSFTSPVLPSTIPSAPVSTNAAPLQTPNRNIANSQQSNAASSTSLVMIGGIVAGVVLLSMIGIYIFRKTSLRKSTAFKNRMKPKTFSFLGKEPAPVNNSGVPKMEDYVSQPPVMYQSNYSQSNASHGNYTTAAPGYHYGQGSQVSYNGTAYSNSNKNGYYQQSGPYGY
jgi:hypothetical protein